MDLSTNQYDELERAITEGTRLSFWRRGTEYIVIPEALRLRNGREVVEARHPSTGQGLVLAIDEIESFEVIR